MSISNIPFICKGMIAVVLILTSVLMFVVSSSMQPYHDVIVNQTNTTTASFQNISACDDNNFLCTASYTYNGSLIYDIYNIDQNNIGSILPTKNINVDNQTFNGIFNGFMRCAGDTVCHISYNYTINETEYFTTRQTSADELVNMESNITVRYDPNNPSGDLPTKTSTSSIKIILLIIASLLIVIGLLVLAKIVGGVFQDDRELRHTTSNMIHLDDIGHFSEA
jgi:hypothetical protein